MLGSPPWVPSSPMIFSYGSRLLSTVGRLSASGVTMLGMAALDERGEAVYDPHVAGRLAARGMEVAAATPEHFAEWVGEVMA